MHKEAATAETLFRAAKALGIQPTEGDWRVIAKLIRKGKIKSLEDLSGPSQRLLRKIQAEPRVEHAELWIPGKSSRHYVRGDETSVPFGSPKIRDRLTRQVEERLAAGDDMADIAKGVRRQVVLRRSVHSHPDVPDVIRQDREQRRKGVQEAQKYVQYYPPEQQARQLAYLKKMEEVLSSQYPGAVPSAGDLEQFTTAMAPGWHGVFDVASGRTGHYRATGRPRWVVSQPKTASAKMRTVEGMLGAVLGGAAGGAGGALFFEPTEPREWSDQYGNVYDRPLTPEETKARRQFMARAALLGALGGAGASLGASSLIAKRLANAERAAARAAVEDHLEPFRKVLNTYKAQAARVAGSGGDLEKRWARRLKVAEKLYQQQEAQADKLVEVAAGRRAHLLFHGKLHPADSGAIDWRDYSAANLADQHFDRLAKKQGLPPVFSQVPRTGADQRAAEVQAQEVFDSMVTSALHRKTAAASFDEELEKISRRKGPDYFGGCKKLEIPPEVRRSFNRRLREAGLRPEDVGLSRTSKGYSAHTHRAGSGYVEDPSKIPLARLKFIASTG